MLTLRIQQMLTLRFRVVEELTSRCRRQAYASFARDSEMSLDEFMFSRSNKFASGSHAEVYMGQQWTTGRDVAVKVMSEHLSLLTDATKGTISTSIELESKAYNNLLNAGETHPNIVQTLGKFESLGREASECGVDVPDDASVHYFVAELLVGGTLLGEMEDRRNRGRTFQTDEVFAVARAVCQGLKFLHAQGIVHRDVKPANLAFGSAERDPSSLKLIDFSVAGVASDATTASFWRRVGTDNWVAPEVLASDDDNLDPGSRYGLGCDTFSLGCVLHAMVAGQPPVVDLDASQVVVTSIPADADPHLKHLLESMLSEDPSRRITVTEVLESCLLE